MHIYYKTPLPNVAIAVLIVYSISLPFIVSTYILITAGVFAFLSIAIDVPIFPYFTQITIVFDL